MCSRVSGNTTRGEADYNNNNNNNNNEADKTLLKRILTDNRHVLHPLLPARTQNRHGLRHRRHDRELPTKTAQLDKSNFLIRMLYKDIY